MSINAGGQSVGDIRLDNAIKQLTEICCRGYDVLCKLPTESNSWSTVSFLELQSSNGHTG
jgi:hypothetical protein